MRYDAAFTSNPDNAIRLAEQQQAEKTQKEREGCGLAGEARDGAQGEMEEDNTEPGTKMVDGGAGSRNGDGRGGGDRGDPGSSNATYTPEDADIVIGYEYSTRQPAKNFGCKRVRVDGFVDGILGVLSSCN